VRGVKKIDKTNFVEKKRGSLKRTKPSVFQDRKNMHPTHRKTQGINVEVDIGGGGTIRISPGEGKKDQKL